MHGLLLWASVVRKKHPFLFYVCYSLAMSTVFQDSLHLISLNRDMERNFETFKDFLHSSLAYGYNDALGGGMGSTSYTEHQCFPTS